MMENDVNATSGVNMSDMDSLLLCAACMNKCGQYLDLFLCCLEFTCNMCF